MSNQPSRRAILSLYHSTLRTSKSFSSYNFRNYFIRRSKDTFRVIQSESDPARVKSLYAEATRELAALRRSAIVNQLYGGSRLAVEDQKPEMTRADT
ncbi:hypothetical protein GGU11DRAFT_677968 [Lentinula aff. detonsa]|uniref:Complex 1 LYR protein domain-containing protein n=2 Tax=Lentinula TaxID=5352 RepID=A0AA38NQT7_9AGAR|nr:hypothetical protein GGU10DRAFT_54882 [Lentinula aff. detonsa]KAJ3800129.1 hypothetical protein GGU11DRAFT_677968 [Lentinula aff. detonsa]KAJ3983544.1 hypothetical protein F5890DRAFT_172824 [Lentinula detonsa]